MIDKPINSIRYDLLETYEEYEERKSRHNERITLWHTCHIVEKGYLAWSVPDSVFYADKNPDLMSD